MNMNGTDTKVIETSLKEATQRGVAFSFRKWMSSLDPGIIIAAVGQVITVAGGMMVSRL